MESATIPLWREIIKKVKSEPVLVTIVILLVLLIRWPVNQGDIFSLSLCFTLIAFAVFLIILQFILTNSRKNANLIASTVGSHILHAINSNISELKPLLRAQFYAEIARRLRNVNKDINQEPYTTFLDGISKNLERERKKLGDPEELQGVPPRT